MVFLDDRGEKYPHPPPEELLDSTRKWGKHPPPDSSTYRSPASPPPEAGFRCVRARRRQRQPTVTEPELRPTPTSGCLRVRFPAWQIQVSPHVPASSSSVVE